MKSSANGDHRLGYHLSHHVQRDVGVVDATSLFLRDDTEVYGWATLDGDTRDAFMTWVS